jgi:hypothetical protein
MKKHTVLVAIFVIDGVRRSWHGPGFCIRHAATEAPVSRLLSNSGHVYCSRAAPKHWSIAYGDTRFTVLQEIVTNPVARRRSSRGCQLHPDAVTFRRSTL